MTQDIAGRFTAVSRRRSIVARLLTASSVALMIAIASGQVAQGREGSPATGPGLQASADAPEQALRSEGSGTASTFNDQSASIHGDPDAVAVPIDVPGGLGRTRTGFMTWICGGGYCIVCKGLQCRVGGY